MQRNDRDNTEMAGDQYVELEEYVEVISTEDKRIKIIGEELGNDTGRAIFTTISKGVTSPNELAKILDVSLPLVNWHVNRLVQVGLIRIEELKMSSKNRPVKYYGPAKTVLVIVPPEGESGNGHLQQKRSKFDMIWSRLNRNIITVISFISGTSVIYGLGRFLAGGDTGSGIQLADPDAVASISGGSDITVAVLGGTIIGAAVLLASRLAKKD